MVENDEHEREENTEIDRGKLLREHEIDHSHETQRRQQRATEQEPDHEDDVERQFCYGSANLAVAAVLLWISQPCVIVVAVLLWICQPC